MGNRATALALNAERPAGIYETEGMPVRVGDTRFTLSLHRPRLDEKQWPDRGSGGRGITFALDRADGIITSGLDTEVVRAAAFLSLDGGKTWESRGLVGCQGGHHFTNGTLVLGSQYFGLLPEPLNKRRRLKIVLAQAERLTTRVSVQTWSAAWPLGKTFDLHRSITVEGAEGGGAVAASTATSSGNLSRNGTNRLAAIFSGHWSSGGSLGAGTYTFNGAGATELYDSPAQTYYGTACGLLKDASYPGSDGTISATLDSAADALCVAGIALSGVDQTTSNDAPPAVSSGAGTAPTHTVSAGDAEDVRVAGMFGGEWATAPTVGAGEAMNVQSTAVSGGTDFWLSISTKTDGGADAMNWTPAPSGGANRWLMRGFNVNAIAGAAAATNISSILQNYRNMRLM